MTMPFFFGGFATLIVVNKRHVVFFSLWLLYSWHSLQKSFSPLVRLHPVMCVEVKDAGLLTDVKSIKTVSTVPLSVASVPLTEPCQPPDHSCTVCATLSRDEKARCLTPLKQV